MKILKLLVLAFLAAALISSGVLTRTVTSQSGPTEAPTGFDNQTNGFTDQATFDADKAAFEEREEIADGLGPVYNAQACSECHQNPVTGGITQIFELRAGHSGPDGNFVSAPGGSLITARAIDAQIQERVPDGARIAFTDNNGKISVMGFDGGQYGPIGNTPVNGTYVTFSPDGTKIAFAQSLSAAVQNIFVMSSDGTGLTQITTTSAHDTQPAWAPNGTKIAFASDRTGLGQIFTMNPDGTGQTQISNSVADDTEPAWSPDSTTIAFVRTPRSINPHSDIWKFSSTGGRSNTAYSDVHRQ